MTQHTPQDSQSELREELESIAAQLGEEPSYAEKLLAKIEAYITTRVKEALKVARSKDLYKSEFGHEVYIHNTADGWCCACEADQAFMDRRVKEAELETLDMAYDTIISYGYMRGDGLYMNGGFSTQELAFSFMRRIGAVDRNGLFDPQKYMKYLDDLTTTTNGKEE